MRGGSDRSAKKPASEANPVTRTPQAHTNGLQRETSQRLQPRDAREYSRATARRTHPALTRTHPR
jgi:hypothetical protein